MRVRRADAVPVPFVDEDHDVRAGEAASRGVPLPEQRAKLGAFWVR